MGRFIHECVLTKAGSRVTARAMYDAYTRWCQANAERVWSETAFGKALPERGLEKTTGRVREYLDVELVNVPTDASAKGGPTEHEPPPHEGEAD